MTELQAGLPALCPRRGEPRGGCREAPRGVWVCLRAPSAGRLASHEASALGSSVPVWGWGLSPRLGWVPPPASGCLHHRWVWLHEVCQVQGLHPPATPGASGPVSPAALQQPLAPSAEPYRNGMDRPPELEGVNMAGSPKAFGGEPAAARLSCCPVGCRGPRAVAGRKADRSHCWRGICSARKHMGS